VEKLLHERSHWKSCQCDADTSDHGCPINNGNAIVRSCRTNGTLLSNWTTAETIKVVFRYTQFRASMRIESRGTTASITFG
jgi:hypothetical protein